MSDRVAGAFLHAASWLIRRLPTAWFGPAAGLLAELRGLAGRDVRVMRHNLAVVLGLPPGSAAARGMERRCVRHQIVAALETVRISFDQRRLDIAAMEGFDGFRGLIAEAEDRGRGQVLVTGHLGAWELLAQSTVLAASRPVAAVAKPSRAASASLFFEQMRARAGVRVIWSGRKSLLRDMRNCLARRETLIMVVDQRPDQRRGPEVDFLGRRTDFVGGPAALAARSDCPLLAAFCVREGPFTYRLESELLRRPGGSQDAVELSQRIAAAIERRVRAQPEQWMWNYRRWHYDPEELAAVGLAARGKKVPVAPGAVRRPSGKAR